MNPYGTRSLRFKNITEINWKIDLSYGTTQTSPNRIQTIHTNWMAPPGTNEVQEAIFNNYQHKKLKSFSWKLDNWRMFIETRTTVAAIGSAPATTDVQIVEAPNWVYWYWRQQTETNTTPPAAGDESRFTRFIARNPKSKIWGRIPIAYNRMDWVTGTYRSLFSTSPSTPFTNLDNYLKALGNTSYQYSATDSSGMPCSDIHIMPDDPYPTTFYPNPTTGTTRTVSLHIVVDMHTYTSWKLMKPEVAPIAP